MTKIKHSIHIMIVAVILGGVSTLLAGTQAQAQGGRIDGFTYLIPFPADILDDQFEEGLSNRPPARPDTLINADINTAISVSVLLAGSKIYYDHWEDGFEPNLTSPTQSSTQVWGDGIPDNNGSRVPLGLPANDRLGADTVLILRNVINLPRDPANLFFDGGDSLTSSGGALAVSMAFWVDQDPGVLFTDAWELYPTNRWGTDYVIPIGEDLAGTGPNQRLGFDVVGLHVQAVLDNTAIEVDLDGDGNVDDTATLNQGETYSQLGDEGVAPAGNSVRVGARVSASAPVQVTLIAMNPLSRYEARGYTLVPEDQWVGDYMAPRSSDGDFWIFNPHDTPLEVTAQTVTGTTTLPLIDPNTTLKFPEIGLAAATGVRFRSTDGRRFYGIGALDQDSAQDWGYALIPEANLTSQVLIGLGLGNDNNPPGPSTNPLATGFESRVYVTAAEETTFRVDFNGDRVVDRTFENVPALTELAITDDSDFDMTGAYIYTTGDTPFVAAWGQDETATPGSPSIDAGTSIAPLRSLAAQKTFSLQTDSDCNGILSLADAVRFDLLYFNNSGIAINNITLRDDLSLGLSYVPNSTVINGQPVADSTSGTPFIFDEGGYNVGTLDGLVTGTITYRAIVSDVSGTLSNVAVVAAPRVPGGSDGAFIDIPTGSGDPILEVSTTLVEPSSGDITSGQNLTFSLIITNVSPSTIVELPLRYAFEENNLTFGSATIPPNSSAPGLLTWDDLTASLNDLGPGQSASTLINLVVDSVAAATDTLVEGTVTGAVRNDSPTPLICGSSARVRLLPPPPTRTPPPPNTPPPPPPTVPPPPTTTTPPPPTTTPPVVAFIPGAPTATVFPVAFLPETGTREIQLKDLAWVGALLMLLIAGIGAIIRFGHK